MPLSSNLNLSLNLSSDLQLKLHPVSDLSVIALTSVPNELRIAHLRHLEYGEMDAESLSQIERIVTASTDQMRQEMTGIAGGVRREMWLMDPALVTASKRRSATWVCLPKGSGTMCSLWQKRGSSTVNVLQIFAGKSKCRLEKREPAPTLV